MNSRVRKIALSLLDVGFGSAATMMLTVVAARAVDVQGFGIFGLLFATVTAVQSVVQGGYIDVVLKSPGAVAASFWSIDRFFVIFLFLGLFPVVIELLSGETAPIAYACGVIGAAFLFIRHSWVRAYYHVRGSLVRSVLASFGLALVAGAFLFLAMVAEIDGWTILIAAIVLSYGVPGIFSARDIFLGRVKSSVRTHGFWRWDYAAESAVLVSSVQISSVFVTPALGLQFSAGFRGGNLLLGPLSMFYASLRLILLPALSRRVGSLRFVGLSVCAIGFMASAWCVIGAWLLSVIGVNLLGQSIEATKDIYWWLAGSYLSQGIYLVLFLAGRAWDMDIQVRRVRVVQLLCMFLGVACAIAFVNPSAYFLGTILGNVVASLGLTIFMLRR